MQKIFITGATGFIGSNLVKHFSQNGFSVKAMKRKSSLIPDILAENTAIEWTEGDLEDIHFLDNALEDCTDVIHAAAMVSLAKKDENKMRKTNVEGTANLVNVSLGKNLHKFLHISSIAAIGNPAKGGKIVNEKQKFEESGSNYGQSKYEAELEVWRGHAEGLPALIVNPSFVIGYGDFNRSSLRLFKYISSGKAFFSPKGSLNCTDVRDLVNICEILLKSNKIGERYIINSANIPYREIFKKAALAMNVKPPKYTLNTRLGLFLTYFSEFFALLTGREPLITREAILAGKSDFFYDNAKIIAETHYHFKDIFESIDEIAHEFNKSKVLQK
jgi:nucleoside-diphosphate-sugar epimerase